MKFLYPSAVIRHRASEKGTHSEAFQPWRWVLLAAILLAVVTIGTFYFSSAQAQEANGAITGLTLTSDTPGTLTVSWDTASPAPTDYRVDWAKSTEEYQSWTVDKGHVYPAETATTVTITDLDHDIEYKIRLRARYYKGEHEDEPWGGPWATATITVAGEPAETPTPEPEQEEESTTEAGTIDTLAATDDDTGQLVLTWGPPAAPNATPTDYHVNWAKSTEDYPADTAEAGNVHPTTTTHTLASLEYDTEYNIRVRARYTDGENADSPWTGPWTETTSQVKQPLPAAPNLVGTTLTLEGHVMLSWQDPSDDSITGYQVLRGPDADSLVVIEEDTGSNESTYTDTSPPAGQTHTYAVKARNASGLSPLSNTVTGTTPTLTTVDGSAQSSATVEEPVTIGRVTNLSASTHDKEAGAVELNWTAAENAQVYFVAYAKSVDRAAGDHGSLRMVSFATTEGVIRGLEGGTSYDFVAVGMRWNLSDFVAGWGDWSDSKSATTRPVTVSPTNIAVDPATVSNSSPSAGEAFTLSATVRNLGPGRSGPTTLRYYRLSGATIKPVGTDTVSGLDASSSDVQTIELTAPGDPGAYHFIVCADSVLGETNDGDNCSGPVTVTVGAETATAPDLVVISGRIVVSRIYLEAGATTQARVIVENQGDGASSATTARFYWSTDATINPSEDTEGGTVALAALAADATSDQLSFNVNNPNQPGLYYFGVCVDAVSGESDTTNNCQSSRHSRITVKGTDLTVSVWKGGVNRDYAHLVVDRSFTLQAGVSSNGLAGKATTVRYYRSTDATISTSDTELGTRSVPAIRVPSTSSSHSFSSTAPSTAGTYYYGACVDPIATESSTTNNCSGALTVTVDATAAPDLTVSWISQNGGNLLVDASFTLNAYVWNPGSAASGSTTLRYYRSTDSTITTSDTSLGTDSVDGLARGGNSAQSIDLTAPSEAGTYYYGACVGTVAGESVTTNNCSDALTVKVEAAAVPDLSVSAFVSTRGITVYDPIGISYSVRNQGSGSSDATTLRFYRSTDGTITTADTELDTASVSGLTTGASSSHQFETTLPRGDGTYYYGTCVDAVTDESDTTNNCSSSWSFTVSNGVFAD